MELTGETLDPRERYRLFTSRNDDETITVSVLNEVPHFYGSGGHVATRAYVDLTLESAIRLRDELTRLINND